jgi:hypothetical protein
VFGWGGLGFGREAFSRQHSAKAKAKAKAKNILPQRRRERRGKAKRKELLLPEILRGRMERERVLEQYNNFVRFYRICCEI